MAVTSSPKQQEAEARQAQESLDSLNLDPRPGGAIGWPRPGKA